MMDDRDQAMRELAELYALGGLEPEERAAVEAYLSNEGCSDAIKRGRLVAYALAASVAERPPADLRARVLAIAKAGARAGATAPAVRAQGRPSDAPLRPVWWMQPTWLAAAAAVVVVIFAAVWARDAWFTPRTWAIACTANVSPCEGRVVLAGAGSLRFEAHRMPALPAGKVYQAWYIRPGAKPTPAPTFSPDASGDASVALPVGAEKGLTVAITVEPQGGSQAPTTTPLMTASIQ